MDIKHLSLTFITASILAACSSSPVEEANTQNLGIYTLEECNWQDGDDGAPAWSCNQLPADERFVAFAKGLARTSKFDTTLSENTAQASALGALRQQIEAKVEKGVKQASVQTGSAGTEDETLDTANSQVLNLIVEGSVKNSRLLKSIAGPDGYTYVLMGVSKDGFEDMVASSVKSSFGNEKAQYQMFLADKIQDEFDNDFKGDTNP
jgi:hypothetical protein